MLAALVFLVAVAGCAVLNPRTADEEVKARAQQRWDALVKGDLKAAYALMSPGSRAATTYESYVTSIRVGFWKSARVERVVCESKEACEAHVTIEYEFRSQRIKTPLRETWIREGTDWWYVKRN
ncbi:MAG TPA: hypothetical protein VFK48_02575 [Usitatibacter sp.]|nr:hypothetical protein [Usitatibacter sp.]